MSDPDILYLDKQLSYLVTLLPLSRLNRPDLTWQLEPGEPRRLVLRRMVEPYTTDELTVAYDYRAQRWDIRARRCFLPSDPSDGTMTGAMPLRDNYLDIAALTTLVGKMEQHFAPETQVVTLGTMSFDPIEGESDYVYRCRCGEVGKCESCARDADPDGCGRREGCADGSRYADEAGRQAAGLSARGAGR